MSYCFAKMSLETYIYIPTFTATVPSFIPPSYASTQSMGRDMTYETEFFFLFDCFNRSRILRVVKKTAGGEGPNSCGKSIIYPYLQINKFATSIIKVLDTLHCIAAFNWFRQSRIILLTTHPYKIKGEREKILRGRFK